MTQDAEPKRQRAIRVTDSDWERVAQRAATAGLLISDYVVWRALAPPTPRFSSEVLPAAVQVRVAQAILTLFASEERRMVAEGRGEEWETAQQEVGRWLERQEGIG